MSTTLEIQPTSTSSSLSNGESAINSDEFVLVSHLSEGSKSCQASLGEGASQSNSIGAHTDNEILEKAIALGKENDRLKETLQHNNFILQQYIKDFTEMQESHRANNENVKREHQRAKEVVRKLRNENRALREELQTVQLHIGQELKGEKEVDLERENAFMKEQITSFQIHVANIDEELKEYEISESTAENWQQLLGSLASYNYKAGIPHRNEKTLAQEMSGVDESPGRKPCENSCVLETITEKDLLKVGIEKIKADKHNLEERLGEFQHENIKLKTQLVQIKEEKVQLRKILDEQCEITLKEEKVSQTLQEEVQKLHEELKITQEKLVKTIEENEGLNKLQQMEMEQQLKSQGEITEEDYENMHQHCREKYSAMQELYFKLQKELNTREDRENSLCAKEKELENEKKLIQQKMEETRNRLVAELESHAKSFTEKNNQLHLELQEARDREESLQEQLDQLQTESSERESLQTESSERESLREQVCQLIKENDAMRIKIEKLTELNSRRDTLYEERMKAMEKGRKEKEKEDLSIIGMLQNQLGAAKEERKKYQDQSLILKAEHDRLAFQHHQTVKEYDDVLNSYKSNLHDNRIRSSNSDAEIENYKGQMDEMEAHLTGLKEECHKKETIIKDMQNRIRLMEAQSSEDVPVLKQQLEVYYNDFTSEREAREQQHAQILTLQEQNQQLAEANRDLQRELDNVQNHQQMADMQRRHLSHSGQFNPEAFQVGYQSRRGGEPVHERPVEPHAQRNEPRAQGPQHELEEPINCPGCGSEFWSFTDGEAHVRQCQAAIQRNQQTINDKQCPICGNEYPDQDTLEIHVQECLRDVQ